MGRRRRQSSAEDIMDVVALLPWWGGVLLAVVSYVLFHSLATRRIAVDPRAVADSFLPMALAGVSTALQFVVPVLCLFGAVASFLQRRKRAALVTQATASQAPDVLNGMTWREFELLVGEGFRLQGYSVTEMGGAQADGGVDLVLRRGNETYLVQCKQWRAMKVGVDVVRELYGVMAARGVAGGFVVTSGRFTEDAVAFAAGRNVRLVDGAKLHGLLQQARAALSARAGTSATQAAATPSSPLPECPKCNAAMVRRTAKKGVNSGSHFWGCSNFPKCHGTRA